MRHTTPSRARAHLEELVGARARVVGVRARDRERAADLAIQSGHTIAGTAEDPPPYLSPPSETTMATTVARSRRARRRGGHQLRVTAAKDAGRDRGTHVGRVGALARVVEQQRDDVGAALGLPERLRVTAARLLSGREKTRILMMRDTSSFPDDACSHRALAGAPPGTRSAHVRWSQPCTNVGSLSRCSQ